MSGCGEACLAIPIDPPTLDSAPGLRPVVASNALSLPM